MANECVEPVPADFVGLVCHGVAACAHACGWCGDAAIVLYQSLCLTLD